MSKKLPTFEEVVHFHGHSCPGLAFGYQAARCALEHLSADRSADEEIVAIVENDACGVDAIQVMTGCTLGKGNLIYRDLGKHAWSFIKRDKSDAIRIVTKPEENMGQDPMFKTLREKVFSGNATAEEEERFHHQMDKQTQDLLSKKPCDIFIVQKITPDIPEKARIFATVPCSKCGEMVAEHRVRLMDGKLVCLTCNSEYGRGWDT
ncbi:MAG TPA: FmdE family protein [Methanospirillum sp.]|nr:FmdE family protein [Methanospirillum sp.]